MPAIRGQLFKRDIIVRDIYLISRVSIQKHTQSKKHRNKKKDAMLCYAMMRHAAFNPLSSSPSFPKLFSHTSMFSSYPFFLDLQDVFHFFTLGESTFTPCALSHTLALTLAGILRPLNL